MMSFLTYITGFFMNFELLPIMQTRRFLWEFPIGFYVKLISAVAAILVGGMKCQTQFWKDPDFQPR
jgi:hypothetical protein